MKTRIALISLLVLALSCKKKENPVVAEEEPVKTPEQPKVYDNYSALKVGNYWVYNLVMISEKGEELDWDKDSVVIDKDTLIRGRTFYKFLTYRNNYKMVYGKPQYYADSLHYIITPAQIIFSAEDTSTVFHQEYLYYYWAPEDTVVRITQKMTDMNVTTTVPAGTFKTSSSTTWYHLWPKHVAPGFINPRYSNRRYAKGVGMVMSRLEPYLGYKGETEMRLVRYKVN